ncbi:hypothetical protein BX666DRAFT_1969666 [Dichotomocladium elegans]|nr:hypothetical protein BX666DRAFT_1969666 [Dichotomocladium elegans]
MTWDTENNDDCNADTSGDVCGELAVGAWHTLIDHNFKDRNDGLGSGNLHRAGTNFKPVDEEAILRQRYKLPNPQG